MSKVFHFFKTNTWVPKGLTLTVMAILANHLLEVDNFPLSDSYTFPFVSILTSLVVGSLIFIIAELNFRYFERKYFTEKINTQILVIFLSSTLGSITLLYIPCFYIVVWLQEGDFGFYYLLAGLSVTLLISALAIVALYAQKIYNLHKPETLTPRFMIEKGGKKTLLDLSDIAYFYSENKVVYAVQSSGQIISTDFTLSEIEEKINSSLFLRANRQTFIHARAVTEIKAIENGKLLVTLAPTVSHKKVMEVVVSRYKKKAFNEWFESKQE